jgi:hypothetical protein
MEMLCELLVWMCLDAESLLDGEDFEEERKVTVGCRKALDDGRAKKVGMGSEVC